jgi:hypothetical protein
MHTAFGDMIWVVCGLGILVAGWTLLFSGKTWDEYGKNHLLMDQDAPGTGGPPAAVASAAELRERDAEIRQMLEARNERRARHGQAPLDIEAEFARLTAPTPGPAIDPELRAEIRDLVQARNHRRARRGEPPLDVEAEIEREIAQLAQV